MCKISVLLYSTVQYLTFGRHVLTPAEKMRGDSIWWIVLLGLYPRGFENNFRTFESTAPGI